MVRTTTTPHAPPPLQPTQLMPFWDRTGPGSCSLSGRQLSAPPPLIIGQLAPLQITSHNRQRVTFPRHISDTQRRSPVQLPGRAQGVQVSIPKMYTENKYSPGNSGDQLLDYLGFLLHLCTLRIWARHLQLRNFRTLSSSFRILNRGHECANKGNVLDRTNKQSIPLIDTSCIRCPPSCYLRL